MKEAVALLEADVAFAVVPSDTKVAAQRGSASLNHVDPEPWSRHPLTAAVARLSKHQARQPSSSNMASSIGGPHRGHSQHDGEAGRSSHHWTDHDRVC